MICGSIVPIWGLVVLALQDVSGQNSTLMPANKSVEVSTKPTTKLSTKPPTNPPEPTAKPLTTTSSTEKTCFILNFVLTTKSLVQDLKSIWKLIMSFVKGLFGSTPELSEKYLSQQNTTLESYIEGEAQVHIIVEKDDQLLKEIFLQWIRSNGTFHDFTFKRDNASIKECKVTYTNWKAKDDECSKCSDGGGGPFDIQAACVPETGYSCKGLTKKKEKTSKDCVKYCDDSSAVVISQLALAIGILLYFSFIF